MNIINSDLILYHGTSSIFLDSMKENGLGFRDKEVFNRDILFNLYQECKKHTDKKEVVEKVLSIKWLIETILEEKGRFQYNGFYLTPSKQSAIRYGCKFPGEYLTTIREVFDALLIANKNSANKIISKEHPIRKLFKKEKESKPVLISLNLKDIPIQHFSGDNNIDIQTRLSDIQRIKGECLEKNLPEDVLLQQYDIVLKKIYPFELTEWEFISKEDQDIYT